MKNLNEIHEIYIYTNDLYIFMIYFILYYNLIQIMNKILKENEIKQFQRDGAIFLKNKFDLFWHNLQIKRNRNPRWLFVKIRTYD